ncbi:hypothetical protein D0T85_14595 [Bacteroides sp. 519]|nr:hypothetical protein [Bacteroides sp. 519]
MHLYFRMINHYFIFRYKETGVRKHEAKRVELFNISQSDKNYKPIKLTYSKDSGKMDRFVHNYLVKLSEKHPELIKEIYEIHRVMTKEYRLKVKKENTSI